jgi:hypothetical protein
MTRIKIGTAALLMVGMAGGQETVKPLCLPNGECAPFTTDLRSRWKTSEVSQMVASITVSPITSQVFAVYRQDGGLAMEVRRDGTVTFGPGVTPNEAANEFAKAMRSIGVCVAADRKSEKSKESK